MTAKLTDEQRAAILKMMLDYSFWSALAVDPADHARLDDETIAYVESLLAAERERCKRLCDQMAAQFPSSPTPRCVAQELGENIELGTTELGGSGAAIRARG